MAQKSAISSRKATRTPLSTAEIDKLTKIPHDITQTEFKTFWAQFAADVIAALDNEKRWPAAYPVMCKRLAKTLELIQHRKDLNRLFAEPSPASRIARIAVDLAEKVKVSEQESAAWDALKILRGVKVAGARTPRPLNIPGYVEEEQEEGSASAVLPAESTSAAVKPAPTSAGSQAPALAGTSVLPQPLPTTTPAPVALSTGGAPAAVAGLAGTQDGPSNAAKGKARATEADIQPAPPMQVGQDPQDSDEDAEAEDEEEMSPAPQVKMEWDGVESFDDYMARMNAEKASPPAEARPTHPRPKPSGAPAAPLRPSAPPRANAQADIESQTTPDYKTHSPPPVRLALNNPRCEYCEKKNWKCQRQTTKRSSKACYTCNKFKQGCSLTGNPKRPKPKTKKGEDDEEDEEEEEEEDVKPKAKKAKPEPEPGELAALAASGSKSKRKRKEEGDADADRPKKKHAGDKGKAPARDEKRVSTNTDADKLQESLNATNVSLATLTARVDRFSGRTQSMESTANEALEIAGGASARVQDLRAENSDLRLRLSRVESHVQALQTIIDQHLFRKSAPPPLSSVLKKAGNPVWGAPSQVGGQSGLSLFAFSGSVNPPGANQFSFEYRSNTPPGIAGPSGQSHFAPYRPDTPPSLRPASPSNMDEGLDAMLNPGDFVRTGNSVDPVVRDVSPRSTSFSAPAPVPALAADPVEAVTLPTLLPNASAHALLRHSPGHATTPGGSPPPQPFSPKPLSKDEAACADTANAPPQDDVAPAHATTPAGSPPPQTDTANSLPEDEVAQSPASEQHTGVNGGTNTQSDEHAVAHSSRPETRGNEEEMELDYGPDYDKPEVQEVKPKDDNIDQVSPLTADAPTASQQEAQDVLTDLPDVPGVARRVLRSASSSRSNVQPRSSGPAEQTSDSVAGRKRSGSSSSSGAGDRPKRPRTNSLAQSADGIERRPGPVTRSGSLPRNVQPPVVPEPGRRSRSNSIRP